jgi:hypothetical protein
MQHLQLLLNLYNVVRHSRAQAHATPATEHRRMQQSTGACKHLQLLLNLYNVVGHQLTDLLLDILRIHNLRGV